jgi:hypothetical protein
MLIYKYQFPIADNFELELPVNAHILSVSVQRDIPVMWAAFDDGDSDILVKRRFVVVPTGDPIGASLHDLRYIGTIFWQWLVMHVFEITG